MCLCMYLLIAPTCKYSFIFEILSIWFIALHTYGIVFACALCGKERPLRARVPAAWGTDIGTCTPRAPAPFLLSGPGTTACLQRRLRGALYFVVHGVVFDGLRCVK